MYRGASNSTGEGAEKAFLLFEQALEEHIAVLRASRMRVLF